MSLNNIYLLTSHSYRDNHGGTDEKPAIRIKAIKWMMVIQYSCISWSIHNMSSLLWRHSWSHQLSNIQANNKNTRSSKFIQNTRPEAGMIKENESFGLRKK